MSNRDTKGYHTIRVSDELYRSYGRSGTRMRDVLWSSLMPESKTDASPQASPSLPWGTLFIALRRSACPRCAKMIEPGTFAVMTDYADAGGRAIHFIPCARDADLDIRWTRERLNSAFRALMRGTK